MGCHSRQRAHQTPRTAAGLGRYLQILSHASSRYQYSLAPLPNQLQCFFKRCVG